MKLAIGPTARRAAVALIIVVTFCASAAAQTQVRVIRDQATIWRRDVRIPATQVRAGTVLDVIGRDGDWYIVLVPPDLGGTGESGMIAVSVVEPVGGAPRNLPPQTRPQPRASRAPTRGFGIFGSGHVGVTSWLAHETFAAVLGHSFGPMFGAAVEVHMRRSAFIQGGVEFFQQTGQRVAVSNGEVFRLGLADTVRVVPVWGTIGYRKDVRRGAAYVGVGAGSYFYKETSEFSDPGEDVDARFASYHALVGFEFLPGHVIRPAIEAQFTSVPNGLGTSGASAAFGELNLGGAQLRLRLLIGR